jgi:hypothetical protein
MMDLQIDGEGRVFEIEGADFEAHTPSSEKQGREYGAL